MCIYPRMCRNVNVNRGLIVRILVVDVYGDGQALNVFMKCPPVLHQ